MPLVVLLDRAGDVVSLAACFKPYIGAEETVDYGEFEQEFHVLASGVTAEL